MQIQRLFVGKVAISSRGINRCPSFLSRLDVNCSYHYTIFIASLECEPSFGGQRETISGCNIGHKSMEILID